MKTGEGKEKEDEEKKTGRATVSQGPSIDMVAAPLYDKDLIRILAEVNFIQGEVMAVITIAIIMIKMIIMMIIVMRRIMMRIMKMMMIVIILTVGKY